MNHLLRIAGLTAVSFLRDRVVHALLGVAALLLLLVPVFSLFSLRQVQELAVTLSLSGISALLLIFAVLLGASSVWRDIERRYTASVLGLPVSRSAYLLGKYGGIALFLLAATAVLALPAAAAILVSAAQYPSETAVHWPAFFLALAGDCCKYLLLAAVAVLFSALSTSFFLPVFGTLAIYLAGSASQGVREYVAGDFGHQLSPLARGVIEGVYYLLPNLSAFDFKVQAIYGLPLDLAGAALSFAYFLVYTALLLGLAARVFRRRELP